MDEIRLNTMLEDLILNIEETVKRAKENLAGVVNSSLGKRYSRPNLNNMEKFYLRYPDYHAASDGILIWQYFLSKKVIFLSRN